MAKDKAKEATAAEQPPLNRNTFGWLWEFTKGKRGIYLLSIILALCAVGVPQNIEPKKLQGTMFPLCSLFSPH